MDLELPNSKITYYGKIFNETISKQLYVSLLNLPHWIKREIIVGGKKCYQNRLTCFYSSHPEYNYFYSGINNKGHLFSPVILEIKEEVEKKLNYKYKFNYCLLNYYIDGSQNIGMHSDDETDLKYPVIASVSLGAERFFDFQHKYNKTITKKRLKLENGSLIVMDGTTQRYYKHGVPKQMKIKQGRINLTFRVVKIPKKIKII